LGQTSAIEPAPVCLRMRWKMVSIQFGAEEMTRMSFETASLSTLSIFLSNGSCMSSSVETSWNGESHHGICRAVKALISPILKPELLYSVPGRLMCVPVSLNIFGRCRK
jgi:hypothetical protein